jgi:hypothetical protein
MLRRARTPRPVLTKPPRFDVVLALRDGAVGVTP